MVCIARCSAQANGPVRHLPSYRRVVLGRRTSGAAGKQLTRSKIACDPRIHGLFTVIARFLTKAVPRDRRLVSYPDGQATRAL
jgi:hypothetical protein